MELARKAQKGLLAGTLLAVIFFSSGCASMVESMLWSPVDSAVDNYDYKTRVDDYKSRGVSQKNAERAAYEDQFFDKMQKDP